MSSHAMFCYDSVRSYGHVVTSAFTMTKHAHRASNLANEDVNLVGVFDKTWSVFVWKLNATTFKFACKSICFFGETLK